MQLKIQIYYYTDETRKFDDLNIDYKISDCEKRWMTFLNINAIGKYVDTDKNEYGKIFCNGEQFITCVSYEKLIKFIDRMELISDIRTLHE